MALRAARRGAPRGRHLRGEREVLQVGVEEPRLAARPRLALEGGAESRQLDTLERDVPGCTVVELASTGEVSDMKGQLTAVTALLQQLTDRQSGDREHLSRHSTK